MVVKLKIFIMLKIIMNLKMVIENRLEVIGILKIYR